MQVQGDGEVTAKINSVGGALSSFDQKVQSTATATGQTLPRGFDATASAATRAGAAVEGSGKSIATAALGLTSAASGAFGLYNAYDRLEKIQVRIAQTNKAVTAAERAGLDSRRALNDLQAKGITSGAQYESAVLRVSQAQQQAEIATDRLAIAQNDLTQGQVGFALQVLPTVFGAVQGVSSAMTLLKGAHIGVSLASVATAGTMVTGTGAMGGFTFATNAATIGTQKLSIGMRLLHIAMGPVGWIILGIGTAMTLFATNAFGFRDAVDSATEAIGKFFPFMKPVLDALLALAHMAFPDAADAATQSSEEIEFATQQAAAATVANTNKMSDALDKLKDKFKDLGKATDATSSKTKPLVATESEDPFLNKLIGGLSGKRQKLTDEKLRIIQEIGALTSGIRTKLEDLPTDVPGINDLADKIRDELSATLKVDFDFEAEDLDAEFTELKEALTRRAGPLPLELQLKSDALQKDLDSITAKIERTEEHIQGLSGGRGLEELRESLSAGTLNQKGDEFIVHLINQLDSLGEKAVTIKEKLRDVTHVAFTPVVPETEATSTKTLAQATAEWKANKQTTEGIEERIEAMERLQGIIEGRAITPLTDAARKDTAGLTQLAKDQQAAINEFFESIGSKERLDFGVAPEKLQNEVQQVINALIQAETEGSGVTTDLAATTTKSFVDIESAATAASATVGTSMATMSGGVTENATTINSSIFEMRGVFLNSFNIMTDAAGNWSKILHKHLASVLEDFKEVKNEMQNLGIDSVGGKEGNLGKTQRGGGRPSEKLKVDVNLKMSDDLKKFIKKTEIESISDNL